MAVITRANVSLDTSTGQFASQIPDLVAGEALSAGMAVYIKSDGKLWKSNGTAATAPSAFVGIVAADAAAGDAVTAFGVGTRFRYASGMTPGVPLYISTTAGSLADAATTGGTLPVARVVTATDIIIISLVSGAN